MYSTRVSTARVPRVFPDYGSKQTSKNITNFKIWGQTGLDSKKTISYLQLTMCNFRPKNITKVFTCVYINYSLIHKQQS